ncbi:N-acetyl-D-glucosamine kinase-like [Ostrea edulis]|uniref:N-acetyl-D-glucosamine kinase-like n=1 Tax=Ostrea edulis TaxID=37623 RepID=UPI00209462F8|nr:N-acetyl-D-glucosamine kinase-like [Ostrea edulis]
MSTSGYYGGVEGGATHSKMVLMNANGDILAWIDGPSTNQWLIGQEECLKRVNNMVEDAKSKAGLDSSTKLLSLGLSMSGADQKDAQNQLISGIKSKYPQCSQNVFIASDTAGAIATATEKGGIVLIAGTGSNCMLINPDGRAFRCGGWGHLLGDEGSAYWITQTAIKIVFDHEDNLKVSPHDISFVKDVMMKYFQISDRDELLHYFYSKFEKSYIAGLCKELAQGARENKDKLCLELFRQAGEILAEHILGVGPHVAEELLNTPSGLQVVTVGSVWKSWDFMKEGFVNVLKDRAKNPRISKICLLELKESAAIGAASLGAKSIKQTLPIDYLHNASMYFQSEF